MSMIKKVFLGIALLIVIYLAWDFTFKDGGALETAVNAPITLINEAWKGVTAGNTNLIPTFDASGADNIEDADNVD